MVLLRRRGDEVVDFGEGLVRADVQRLQAAREGGRWRCERGGGRRGLGRGRLRGLERDGGGEGGED